MKTINFYFTNLMFPRKSGISGGIIIISAPRVQLRFKIGVISLDSGLSKEI